MIVRPMPLRKPLSIGRERKFAIKPAPQTPARIEKAHVRRRQLPKRASKHVQSLPERIGRGHKSIGILLRFVAVGFLAHRELAFFPRGPRPSLISCCRFSRAWGQCVYGKSRCEGSDLLHPAALQIPTFAELQQLYWFWTECEGAAISEVTFTSASAPLRRRNDTAFLGREPIRSAYCQFGLRRPCRP